MAQSEGGGRKGKTSISMDEETLARARQVAARAGTSLSEWLEDLAVRALAAEAADHFEREALPQVRAIVERGEGRLERRMLALERRVMGVAGYSLWHAILAHYLGAKAVESALDDDEMKAYYEKVQDSAEQLVQRILTEVDAADVADSQGRGQQGKGQR